MKYANRRKIYNPLVTIMLTLLFCAFFYSVKAEAATDIRVGLKALYFGKNIITIYNTDLKMGFCINDSFKADIELKSKGGFSFEPETREYYSDTVLYPTYSKALAALESIIDSDSKADGLVCYGGRNNWFAYVRNVSDKSKYNKISTTELIRLTFGQQALLIDGSISGGYPQFASCGKDKTISLGSRNYRGRIEVGRYGNGSLSAINIVNIESYLLSVVSCEMNTTWHSEAQKVQAVAARSYCLANTGFNADSYLKKGYVIVDTDESQVYAGTGKETEISRYAVKATLKQILKSNGKVLPAYFFSTSGGATEFSTDIWGGNSSSFIGVFDEYETNPEKAPWTIKTTYSELESKLKAKGYSVGTITGIYPEILSDSGRVSSVKIKYKGGSISVKGSVIKSMYDMRSTKFKIITQKSEDFDIVVKGDNLEGDIAAENEVSTSGLYVISGTGQISQIKDTADQLVIISNGNMTNFPVSYPNENEIWFLGMGSGHGIGMSQSGAYGMALKGYKYDEILKYYYNNTELTTY
ncbi:MAG: SpoIID/LytB domain-containing protein [Lachnospiraceae bacterium]|nr:SpoIID/LytB domain-containing protein [Lachnospiraceae bacterium]